jgi:hypothetical protein
MESESNLVEKNWILRRTGLELIALVVLLSFAVTMTFVGMMMHETLHIIIIAVAFGLFVLSAISYRRDRRIKFLYITGAFLTFFIKEIILALSTFIYLDANPVITHPLNLIILILFFVGVTK